MISLETIIASAIANPTVMDQLGEALQNDLVTANPFYRSIVGFADKFLAERRKLPGYGDWEIWLDSLERGMLRDGTKEALGRLWTVDVSTYDPDFLAKSAIVELQRGAAQVARARLNELTTVEPKAILQLAEKVDAVQASTLSGLAKLSDIDIWSTPVREDEYIGTGFPTLNHVLGGGWGKELIILFADSGVGKSILLQNWAVNAAVRGKNVLHITLELGIRPQIHRYYRQIAQVDKGEFNRSPDVVKDRLRHWFRFAKGQVYLIEFAAYELDSDQLKRTVERVARIMGQVDVVALDYLDLMSPTRKGRGGSYEDLGFLTHETRALCPMFDTTVLSASQAIRRPKNSGRLTVQDMGDSYQKVRGSDIILALNQTPEEEEVYQGRLGALKVRDSGGRGTEVALYINRDLSLIQELDHPNVIKLMEKLGHLPHQLQAAGNRGGGVGSSTP